MDHPSRRITAFFGLAGVLLSGLLAGGCADQIRRRELQEVAKGWCETIRASQVIPVYPLTADLRPGDVFLVQTSVGGQADLYKERGFLSLDDLRARLPDAGYENMYGDWYFKNPYSTTGNPYPVFNPAALDPKNPAAAGAISHDVAAPRAAFPSYSFTVKTSGTFGLALPIKGVPVGLNYLRAKTASGTVTIADARTYAGDPARLCETLEDWADEPRNRETLARTARQSHCPVYLRVVTRVYLTGAVIVSLTRTDSGGASVKAGNAPDISLVKPDGTIDDRHAAVLAELNRKSDPITELKNAGGAVKFLDVSESGVVLAEAFDTALVIGYLGFDVPVYKNGDLGGPIPTFELIEGRISDAPIAIDEASTFLSVQQYALRALRHDPGGVEGLRQTARIIERVSDRMYSSDFDESCTLARKALAMPDDSPDLAAATDAALTRFERTVRVFVAKDTESVRRHEQFADTFRREFERRDAPR